MALVLADRVKENTSTTGTGALTLDGADNTFQSFSAVLSDGDTTYYGIVEPSTEEWEVGVGTYASGTNTLARTTILASSNSGSAVNLTAGVAVVFLTQPSEKAVYKDVSGDTDLGTNASVDGYIDFTAIDHPAHAEGRVYFDTNHKTLSYQGDISGLEHEVGIEEHVRVYNNTGSTILKGKPCYWSGNFVVSGGTDVPTIGLGNATDVSKYNVQGLAAHDIANGSFGYIIVSGLVEGFDTSGLSAGDKFFVGLTDGAVQNASPTYPNYPMCLGWVIKSDATNGVVLVNQQNHSVNSFRVRTDAHVGGDLIVAGDLSVFGTTTSVSTENVSSGAAFNYLNAGDTIGEANTTFSGTGLDDAYFGGHFKGTANTTYYVRIDGTGTPDTFEWSKDNFVTTEATLVPVNTAGNTLDNGITIEWGANTGHTLNDTWSGTAAPSNVDTGLFSNRNTGGSGVGYTHVGMFYDVSATEWALVGEYGPEPSGSINTSDSTFVYGDLRAGTIYGTFEGDITGSVTGNVSGNVTGALTAGDNVKATFGTDTDLEIFSDGTHSRIEESTSNTGDLYIRASNNLRLQTWDGVSAWQNAIVMDDAGAAELYHDGSITLTTSSSGIDVTGTVMADGLTVDGNGAFSNAAPRIQLEETDTTDQDVYLRLNAGDFTIETRTDAGVKSGDRIRAASNGDISFYEATGTTPKFFWDASAEKLGIGTTTPGSPIEIQQVANTNVNGLNGLRIQAEGVSNERYLGLGLYSTDGVVIAAGSAASENTSIAFRTASAGTESEAGRFDTDGNLLVGKTVTSFGTAGNRLLPTGGIYGTKDGAAPFAANRLTSDGDIMSFWKDSTQVGSIGTENSHLTIGKGDTGIKFQANEMIIPWNLDANTLRDDAIDLGNSTNRFQSLYLGGQAKLIPGTSGDAIVELGDPSQVEGGPHGFKFYTQGGATNDHYGFFFRTGDTTYNFESLNAATQLIKIAADTGKSIFNYSGRNDADFQVKSDTEDYMLFVDASTNYVSFGTNATDIGSSSTGEGVTYRNGESLRVQRASGPPIIANRVTDDGSAYEVRKNGAGIGYIGNDGSRLVVRGSVDGQAIIFSTDDSTGSDLRLGLDGASGYQQSFRPYNSYTDAKVDLGATTASGGVGNRRFRNAYFSGTVYAASKSFEIDHPTKEGMRLRHGSLEGPEDAVYVRGKLTGTDTIELPDYWTGLVHEDSITVQLTAIGGKSDLWVKDIADNKVKVGCSTEINCFYFIQATRKDVEAWDVEYEA